MCATSTPGWLATSGCSATSTPTSAGPTATTPTPSPAGGASWAESWRFDDVNELIDQHNDYYPIERNLPINPRTGDYVSVSGRSFRRERPDLEWILERFPASSGGR